MKQEEVKKHFDAVAPNYDSYKEKNSFYYNALKKSLRSLIPPDKRIKTNEVIQIAKAAGFELLEASKSHILSWLPFSNYAISFWS